MKIAVGSDEHTHLTDSVVEDLESRGIEVELRGTLKPGDDPDGLRWRAR